jgi:hypothetical protein
VGSRPGVFPVVSIECSGRALSVSSGSAPGTSGIVFVTSARDNQAMPSQADFTNLDQLRLLDHGDAIERHYWPTVSNSLSEYETFWKNFIVLLTNRVDPFADKDWIMLRTGLSEKYESLLIANYSTFYHCVVLSLRRRARADRNRTKGGGRAWVQSSRAVFLLCQSLSRKSASLTRTGWKAPSRPGDKTQSPKVAR